MLPSPTATWRANRLSASCDLTSGGWLSRSDETSASENGSRRERVAPAGQGLTDLRAEVKGRAPRDQDRHSDLPIDEPLDEETGVLEMLRLLEEQRHRPVECRIEIGQDERS